MKKALLVLSLFMLVAFSYFYLAKKPTTPGSTSLTNQAVQTNANPLSIDFMRSKNYPGSEITIEQTLENGVNYRQYVTSYYSEGLKIYALLTMPSRERPSGGWPVIVFNHGYIPPEQYRTTDGYLAYVGTFARSDYIVFKPDYRGNGNSEGQPEGAYYSPAYATDVLNAVSSIKRYKDANPSKIGMWGHSLGGNITLRNLEVSPDIKVAVIWGGVVGSYDDLINNWQRKVPYQPSARELSLRNRSRSNFVSQHGTPQANPVFWSAIDPTFNLNYIAAPIQLHHGTEDEEVPLDFSQKLFDKLKAAGKTVELFTYQGAGHNISSPSFETAIQRSVEFFDKYLKI